MLYLMGRECQQGLWLKQVEKEMEEIYLALDSSPSLPREQDHLSSGSPLPPHRYLLLVLLLEEKRNRHHHDSLHRQDLRASDPPLDTGLLWKAQVLQDLAQQSWHQQG